MFKRKKIYIIMIVVASILLIADLVFYKKTNVTVPSVNGQSFDVSNLPSDGNMPQMPGNTDNDTDSSAAADDASESENGSADAQKPEDMPQSTDGSAPQMPESTDGSAPQMPENMDSSDFDGNMPENSDFSDMGGSMPDMSQMNKFAAIRRFCIPAAILFVLIDLFSIVRLIQISRKKKKTSSGSAEDRDAALSRYEIEAIEAKQAVEAAVQKRSRAKRRNIIIAVILVVCLIALAILTKLISQKNAATSATVDEQVVDTETKIGSIGSVLKSYGTLAAGDSTEVTIPGNVTVTGYAVSDGDSVKKGDLIANVDKTTVLSSIAELQSLMDELDAELESLSDETVSDTVTATVDGRVIAIYAKAGTSVVDTMYDSRSLMLISLDGKMAVDFETDESLSVGDSVKVKTSDGTTYNGKVASSLNGEVTVTITDKGPSVDDTVTVSASDGTKLAQGTLYIHSCQKITGFTGTVSKVHVSAGSSVSAGDTLLTLTDTGYSANYNRLTEERETLEEQMSALMKAYMTGGIYAESDGVISGLTELESSSDNTETETSSETASSETASSESTSSDTASSDTAAAETTSCRTGSSDTDQSGAASSITAAASAYTVSSKCVSAQTASLQTASVCAGMSTVSRGGYYAAAVSDESLISEEENAVLSEAEEESTGTADGTGSDSSISADSADENTGSSDSGSVSGNTDSADDSTAGGDSGSSASDTSGGDTSSDGQETMTTESLAAWILTLDQKTLNEFLNTLDYNTLKTLYDAVRSFEQTQGSTTPSEDSGEASGGTIPSQGGSSASGGAAQSQDSSGSASGGTIPSQSGSSFPSSGSTSGSTVAGYSNSDIASMVQGATGSSSGMDYSSVLSNSAAAALMSGDSSDTEESSDSEKTYKYEETQIGTLTPSDTMNVDITVDELDIMNVLVNTEVQVTLDALTGQSFTGTITHIDTDGSNSGGDTKYTVTVSIDRTDDMLDGMNANVDITLDTTDNVLIIPEAALSEEGGHVYVYTGYDEKNEELTGKTEVTTGVSDGENVEILTGLSEGDTVCYKYAGTINYEFVN